MTPDETKRYIEHRLSELGWNVHIGKSGYDKIFRFTEGTEDETNRLCYKLLSLGSLQEGREITDDVLSMAMTDLAPAKAVHSGNDELELASIDRLTAVLDAKVARGEVEIETRPPASRSVGTAKDGGTTARSASRQTAAPLPKILIADPSVASRTALVKALAKDCAVMEVSDGERAWKTLLEHPDIDLVITDLKMPNTDGHELIKRIRAAISPPHVVGIPIIVVAEPEEANAKLRALMGGANDFVLKTVDPKELRARVLARHRLSKTAPHTSVVAPQAQEKTPRAIVARTGDVKKKMPVTRPPVTIPRKKNGLEETSPPRFAEQQFPKGSESKSRPPVVVARPSFVQRLYHVSSTTTITLSATALLALAIVVILYVGRETSQTSIVALAPPAVESSASQNRIAPASSESAPDVSKDEPANLQNLPSAPPPLSAKEAEKNKTETNLSSGESRTTAVSREDVKTELKPETPKAEIHPSSSAPLAGETKAPVIEQPKPVPAPATPKERPVTPAPASPREEMTAAERSLMPPTPPVSTKISRDELSSFLRRFASMYESGDLDQFLNMFSENARTNDRIGRRGIREDYEALFRATDARRMKLGEMSWELDGNQAYGWGDFDVTVRRSADQETNLYTGSLTFVVEKTDNRLKIVRLYHGQRRADAR